MGVASAATAPVGLGTATGFAVLAGSGVTNTGPTAIGGNLGTCPTPAITGFPPGLVNGTIHANDAVACGAKSDLTIAYNDAAGRAPNATFGGPTELGGTTKKAGVYKSPSSLAITGTLTLDAENDPSAVFIFQAGSTLVTAPNSHVGLINGAQACNVFWQVGSSATIGVASTFVGTVLALTSITLNTNATIQGRVLARNGAVTLDSNTINRPSCAAAATTTTSAATTTTAVGATTTTSVPVTTTSTSVGPTTTIARSTTTTVAVTTTVPVTTTVRPTTTTLVGNTLPPVSTTAAKATTTLPIPTTSVARTTTTLPVATTSRPVPTVAVSTTATKAVTTTIGLVGSVPSTTSTVGPSTTVTLTARAAATTTTTAAATTTSSTTTGASGTAAAFGSGTASLPLTGSSTWWNVLVGGLAVAVGGLLVRQANRVSRTRR